MASKPVTQLNQIEKQQLAVSYASFILSAQGAPVTVEGINNVLKAANLNVSPSLAKAFAKTLATKKVTDFFGGMSGESTSVAASQTSKDEKKGKQAGKDNKDTNKQAKGAKNVPPPPPPPAQDEQLDMGGMFDM